MDYSYNRTAAAKREDYSYNKGPNTPWGRAQVVYHLARGVRWVDTPGHGGLGVSSGVGSQALTPAARKLAISSGGAYWFEEDVKYAIAFYENPGWQKALVSLAGGQVASKEQLEKTIRHWDPEYFELSDLEDMPKLQKGMKLRFLERVLFGRGMDFKPGDEVEVTKVTSSSIVFTPVVSHYGSFKMPYRFYEHDGKVELVK